MSYAGNIALGDTIDIKFSTVSTAGVPTTLAGTPVVSAYPGNSTTQLTAGITLTVDFDGVTGLHNVRVVTTVADGYTTRTNYTLVITTGTVGGSSVVGYVVGSFSIGARVANTVHSGVATAGSATSITLAATASTTADLYKGAVVHILAGTGAGQQRSITAYSTGRVATVDTWATTPDNTSQYVLLLGSSLWEGEAGHTPQDVWEYPTRTVDLSDVTDVLGTPADTDLATDIANLPTAAENAAAIGARVPTAITGVADLASVTHDEIASLVRMLMTNRQTQTGTTRTLYADDGSTPILTWTVSDDGTTFESAEVA